MNKLEQFSLKPRIDTDRHGFFRFLVVSCHRLRCALLVSFGDVSKRPFPSVFIRVHPWLKSFSNASFRQKGEHRTTFNLQLSTFNRLASTLSVLLALLLPNTSSPADNATGDAIECANLIYSGTKSSVCFSEEFLSTAASETSINTSRKFKPIKLGEGEVFRFPFAVMTGEGAFTLTEEERKNLKLYLEKGGFLLASAGCSSKEWGDSFTREIETIFPDRKLAEVAMDHAIFRTVFDINRLDTKHEDAHLFGLTIGGKIVLIYSPDGLNDTATMHGCCCCGGNEIHNSQKVNANILAYALLQ